MERLGKAMNEKPWLRWGILILVGFILSVNYYFYDAFSTLKDLMTKEFGFTNTDYGLFVSFYSIPNTFLLMAVIGGIILDKFGIRRTGFMFVFFMALGAFLTAYGGSKAYSSGGFGYSMMQGILPSYSPELKMMLLGRFFFGLGAETSIVVVSKILVKWFKGRDLALAFGLKVGFGRLGTFAALNLSPVLAADGAHLDTAIWLAAILVITGLFAFLIYMLVDIKLDKQTGETTKQKKEDRFKLSDLGKLLGNRAYLYIALICLTFYAAVFPFNAFAPDFLLNSYGMSYEASGQIASLLPLGTLIFTPFFGFIIDRYGRAATAMIAGSVVLLLVHLTFTFTCMMPQIPMITLGVAFSLVPAAMWPSMVKLVEDKQIGTAYGLMYSIQNLGLWGVPLLAGIILDKTNLGIPWTLNYTPTMFMFIGLSILAVVFAIMLKRVDKKRGYGVDLPMNKS